MKKLLKFLRDTRGAIAVETAIATPIIIFALLPAVDLGIQVYAKQQLAKATKSGAEFVIMGARDDSEIWQVMNASYAGTLNRNDVSIKAYCGCIESNQPTGDNQPSNGQPDETDPYAYVYLKTVTSFGSDMCPTPCNDGGQAAELVSIAVSRDVQGIITHKTVMAELQTRVR